MQLLEKESHVSPIIKNWESMTHITNQDAQAPHRPVSGADTGDTDTGEEVVNNRG